MTIVMNKIKILRVLGVAALLGCSSNDQPNVEREAREPVADAPAATPSTQVVGDGSGWSIVTEAPTTNAPEASGPDASASDAPKGSAPSAEPGKETPLIIEKPAEPTPSDRKDVGKKDTP